MHITLLVDGGPHAGRAFPVVPGTPRLLGRSRGADVSVPDDARMSSRHCEFLWSGDSCRVNDLRSTNGTFVNGGRLTRPVLLQDGDVITAGDTRFRVCVSVGGLPPGGTAEDDMATLRPVEPSRGLIRPVAPPADPSRSPLSWSGTPTLKIEPEPPAAEDPPAGPDDLVLAVREGPETGRQLVVRPGETALVGRGPAAQLSLPHDAQLSGKHFMILGTREGFTLRDFGSRTGTLANGAPVTEPVRLADGDIIVAGGTSFLVILETAELPPSRLPASPPPPAHRPPARVPPTPPESRPARPPAPARPAERPRAEPKSSPPALVPPPVVKPEEPDDPLELLRAMTDPLFALLDAARSPRILELLIQASAELQSLYEGPKGARLAAFAPYLVSLPKGSKVLEPLVREGWGHSWGVYLTSRAAFPEVRKHFRRFLLVRLPDDKEVYFRFYDPRVFREFLSAATADEARQFFGPVSRFVSEGGDPETAVFYGFGTAVDEWRTPVRQTPAVATGELA